MPAKNPQEALKQVIISYGKIVLPIQKVSKPNDTSKTTPAQTTPGK